jgi:hypothetical protein
MPHDEGMGRSARTEAASESVPFAGPANLASIPSLTSSSTGHRSRSLNRDGRRGGSVCAAGEGDFSATSKATPRWARICVLCGEGFLEEGTVWEWDGSRRIEVLVMTDDPLAVAPFDIVLTF